MHVEIPQACPNMYVSFIRRIFALVTLSPAFGRQITFTRFGQRNHCIHTTVSRQLRTQNIFRHNLIIPEKKNFMENLIDVKRSTFLILFNAAFSLISFLFLQPVHQKA